MKLVVLVLLVSQSAFANCRSYTEYVNGFAIVKTECDRPQVYQPEPIQPAQNMRNPTQDFMDGARMFNQGLNQFNRR